MQHKHAHVQPQQRRVTQHQRQRAAGAVHRLRRLGRHPPDHHRDAGQRKKTGQSEESGQADVRDQQRRNDERHGKHQADAHAHQRHGLGAHLVAGLVSKKGADGRRNSAGPLHRAADGQPGQVSRRHGNEAAQREHQQPENDDALAAQPVRGHAKGDLQQPLGQPVNAHGQTHAGRVIAAGVARSLQGKHRQHQKQPQHAQRINR